MGLSFVRGLVASVNPCGFILLPTYLMYFLGLEGSRPGTQRASVRRALLVSAAVSAGFLAVFTAVGLISYHLTNWILEHAKYATLFIGLGLIVLGVAMFAGFKLPIATPQIDAGARQRTLGSMFLYGIAYATASIGCSAPLFISTVFTATRRDGAVDGVSNMVAYAAGMALIVTALTVALAVTNTGLLRVLRSGMRHVDRIAAAFVVVSGVYLVYYFWAVDNDDVDPVTRRVEDIQGWITARLAGRWEATALVLALVVVAAIAYAVTRRDESDAATGRPSAPPPR